MEREEGDDDSDLSAERNRNRNHNSSRGVVSSSPQSPDTPFTPFAEKSKVFEKWMGSTDSMYRKGLHPSSELRNGVKQRLFFTEDHVANRNKPMHKYRVKYRMEGHFTSSSERWEELEAIRMDFAVKKFHSDKPSAKIISCVQMDN